MHDTKKQGRTAAPGSRYGHAAVFADGSAYLFGGMRPAAAGRRAVPSNELFELEHEGLAWRPLVFPVPPGMAEPVLPPERTLTACAFAARLWCFGGLGYARKGGLVKVLGDAWAFDRALLQARELARPRAISRPHLLLGALPSAVDAAQASPRRARARAALQPQDGGGGAAAGRALRRHRQQAVCCAPPGLRNGTHLKPT